MPEQLSLLPEEPLPHEVVAIPLDRLPPDAELEGEPPRKAMVDVYRATGVCPHILLRADLDAMGGPYQVIDGRRRIRAWRMLYREAKAAGDAEGMERYGTIPSIVVLTDAAVSADVISLAAHAHRHDNLAASLVAIERLQAAGGTERSIARATGMSLGTIHRTLQLLKLVPALREAVLHGRITGQVAEQCAKLPASMQESLADGLAHTGRLRLQEVARCRTVRSVVAAQNVLGDLLEAPTPPIDPWQPVTEWIQSLAAGKRQTRRFRVGGTTVTLSVLIRQEQEVAA